MEANAGLIFWGNLGTALAYYVITTQLLLFVHSPQVLKLFAHQSSPKDSKIRHIYRLMMAIAVLFASFICMCGNTHLVGFLRKIYPDNDALRTVQAAIMIGCAFISIVTAIIGFRLFPAVAETFERFELGDDGSIQHSENYLIEVVELIKESILILSDDLFVMRGNDISRVLFGRPVIGTKITDYIKVSDQALFNETVMRVMGSYNFIPATIELRIRRDQSTAIETPILTKSAANKLRVRNSGHIYCERTHTPPGTIPKAPGSSKSSSSTGDEEYIWIECTMCKGKINNDEGGFDYDLKMVCRDIDDRKKRALYQTLIEGTEERGRINESKLRYLSCIAHDLKTPLQSFTFTLDLLNHTDLHPEQREYVQQANVAIDLMKLTISQTMDISKALTGAKLTPRRSTVYLSSVLNRVKIIINGYGKQVPVSFEVAPDVCDEIITDEEWLWQMLLNLLTNACKYTDRGSIHVRLSVTDPGGKAVSENSETEKFYTIAPLFIPQVEPPMLLCEVIDTGIGIDPNKISHIFDAFAQVQEGQVTGTGLGLFGVRTRAEGLQGTCGARHNTESATGTGTVLWFAIPYTPDRDITSGLNCSIKAPSTLQISPTAMQSHSPLEHGPGSVQSNTSTVYAFSAPYHPSPANTMSGEFAQNTEEMLRRLHLSAMVVEDTASVRKLMERLLLKMGFASVVCYENGAKGLQAMMAGSVDIVFSDVQMPIMTGPEMVTRFRKWETEQAARTQNRPYTFSPLSSPHVTHNTHMLERHVSMQEAPGYPASTSPLSSGEGMKTGGVGAWVSGSTGGVGSVGGWVSGGVGSGSSSVGSMDGGNSRGADIPSPEVCARPRQLIVAVTANGAEINGCGVQGFDEICPKPLTKAEIYRIISRYFQ